MRRRYNSLITLFMLMLITAFSHSQNGWYQQYSGTTSSLKSVFFLNTTTGYMTGGTVTIKTENGGLNWFTLSNTLGGESIFFTGPNTGYVGKGNISKTTDGGYTWQTLNAQNSSSIYFMDANTGYTAGTQSTILKTTNGGQTWDDLSPSFSYYKLSSIKFLNSQTGYAVGGMMFMPYGGVILKTINGGINWNFITTNSLDIEFRSVDFTDANIGYAVGSYSYGSSGVIYKTTDGGENWVQQGITNKNLHGVDFVNSSLGYAVGEDGFLIKTVNGGAVWTTQQSNVSTDIYSVKFVREELGYIAGDQGVVQKTQNGGVQTPPFTITGRVLFSDNNNNVTGGKVRALRYDIANDRVITVDSGIIQPNGTYILPHIIPNDTLDIMAYQNDADDASVNHGFVPTYLGNTINWTSAQKIYATGNQNNVDVRVFRLDTTGVSQYHIGGGVFRTVNFGLQTAYVYAKVGNVFKGYGRSGIGGAYQVSSLLPENYLMLCDRMGYFGVSRNVTLGSYNLDTINFYLIPRSPIGIINNGSEIPSSFNLAQNYPNPFNPTTFINFDIPKETDVRITVYDILGRKIGTLVDKFLRAGSYKVDWDGASFSSGMYFYRIETKEFTETKKMLMIK